MNEINNKIRQRDQSTLCFLRAYFHPLSSPLWLESYSKRLPHLLVSGCHLTRVENKSGKGHIRSISFKKNFSRKERVGGTQGEVWCRFFHQKKWLIIVFCWLAIPAIMGEVETFSPCTCWVSCCSSPSTRDEERPHARARSLSLSFPLSLLTFGLPVQLIAKLISVFINCCCCQLGMTGATLSAWNPCRETKRWKNGGNPPPRSKPPKTLSA